jgi:hypothetical protein
LCTVAVTGKYSFLKIKHSRSFTGNYMWAAMCCKLWCIGNFVSLQKKKRHLTIFSKA